MLSDIKSFRAKACLVRLYELLAVIFAVRDDTVVSSLRARTRETRTIKSHARGRKLRWWAGGGKKDLHKCVQVDVWVCGEARIRERNEI